MFWNVSQVLTHLSPPRPRLLMLGTLPAGIILCSSRAKPTQLTLQNASYRALSQIEPGPKFLLAVYQYLICYYQKL